MLCFNFRNIQETEHILQLNLFTYKLNEPNDVAFVSERHAGITEQFS